MHDGGVHERAVTVGGGGKATLTTTLTTTLKTTLTTTLTKTLTTTRHAYRVTLSVQYTSGRHHARLHQATRTEKTTALGSLHPTTPPSTIAPYRWHKYTSSGGSSIVPFVCYSAHEIAWHRWQRPVVAVGGVVLVAFIVRVIPYLVYIHRHHSGNRHYSAVKHFRRKQQCSVFRQHPIKTNQLVINHANN